MNNGHYVYLPSDTERVVPSERVVLKVKLSNEFEDYYRAAADLKQEKSALYAQLEALLNSVTTVGRLQEIWPDGRKFYKDVLIPVTKAGLPALTMQKINDALGLPEKKEKLL